MRLNGGFLTLEVVNGVSQHVCPENVEPSSGEFFVQVDPRAHYLVRLKVNEGGDSSRVFLAYTNINEEYIGYRQCLSQREGFQDISTCSTIVGINQPIRFQQATLLGGENNFHSDILHMGKVTVKIYEGICDHRQSAFGNNAFGNLSYQPGRFLESLTIHCCATPEMGHPYLNPVDQERLKRALMKRNSGSAATTDENYEGHHSHNASRSFKRVKTENGYVSVAAPNNHNHHNGMDCEMVLQPHAFPLA
jgi:hypothetical protein